MEGSDIISSRHGLAGAGGASARWSRRRFVAQGLLALAAAPALVRAAAPTLESPPDLGSTNVTNVTSGSVKGTGSGSVRAASNTDDRLTTAVYVNGSGPYRFLVDTGAERTLIAEEVAAQLSLPQGRKVLLEGIIRGEPAVLVKIESLRMGSLVCPPLEAPVLPRAMLGVDGYLGLDVLDRHRVILDFRAGRLTVTRPQGFFSALWEHFDETVVRTLGSSGRLRATNCLVNGVRAAAFIDTGAEVSVSNPALYAALQRRAGDHPIVGAPVEIFGVTGGTIVGRAIDIEEIRLGGLRWGDAPLVVARLEVFDVWGLSREPALLFGMDCLRRFARVSIDYGRKELSFELASRQMPQRLEAGLPPPLAA
jgi:predicted aspartyl protease